MIPYSRQTIGEDDIAAVVGVLRSSWLTTGPKVAEFEREFASFCGTKEAVAVSNGTAALHCGLRAAGIGPGDEVIVPAVTFAATANAVRYLGARPVFADIDPATVLISVESVEALIGPATRGILAVDYAGQPCDYEALRRLAARHGLFVMADACHSLGGSLRGSPVGSLADFSAFSFHPVKPITTGEGGMITTNDPKAAAAMRQFRNHGIAADFRQREKAGTWFYDVEEVGWNYRLPDLQCALGISQLKKLPAWVGERNRIAETYHTLLRDVPGVRPLAVREGLVHAWHLFMVDVMDSFDGALRDKVFRRMRERGIGVNVLYRPVYHHTAYRQGWAETRCLNAEKVFLRLLALPIFPGLSGPDQERVVGELKSALNTN